MDIMLEGEMDGTEAAEQIRSQFNIPVVYLTAYADEDIVERAKATEPFGYVIKPFEDRELNTAIEIALYKHKMEKKLKESEERLAESNQLLTGVLEHTHMMAVFLDPRFNFIWVNRAYAGTCRHEPSFFPGKNHFTLYPHEENQAIFQRVVDTGEPFFVAAKPFEFADQPERGVTYWDWSLIPIKDNTGKVTGLVFTLAEVTERIRAEEALRDSEARLKALSEASFEGIFFSEKGICIDQNQAVERMFGYTRAEAVGRHGTEWIVPEDREQVKNNMVSGYEKPYEVTALRKDGTTFPAEIQARMLEYKGRTIRVTALRDITERKQAEEALRESEERFRTMADFTYDWEFWRGPDGKYIYVSPSCERITGYQRDEFIKDSGLMEKIVHPDDLEIFLNHYQKALEQDGVLNYDFRIVTRSGEERWINHYCQSVYGDDGSLLGRRSSNRDVSTRKKLEGAILTARKLESLGTLAGGIAHDFNNLLSVIMVNLSLAEEDIKSKNGSLKFLKAAEEASIRAKDLTARLITFSKGGEPVKRVVSIKDSLKDSVSTSLNGSDIDCKFSIPDELSNVNIDQGQIKQAFYNIIINAQEAMAGEGTIRVDCENVTIGENDALTLKSGKYVKISITDQGAGIPVENLAKIFDPYFSTKEMGEVKGMGLGLSSCHSIVENHNGLITVESELGVGTTLSIYLPASDKEIVEPEPVRQPIVEKPVTGKGKVLLMDDEKMIRDYAVPVLSQLGYDAEVSKNGTEAIDLYKKAMESKEPFDVVILDLTNQSGMRGKEAIEKLLEIDPNVKAIVSTGYSDDPVITNFLEYGFCGALTKPYTIGELSKILQNIILGEQE